MTRSVILAIRAYWEGGGVSEATTMRQHYPRTYAPDLNVGA